MTFEQHLTSSPAVDEFELLPSYETLCARLGRKWFEDSWKPVDSWLTALAPSGVQDGQKLWGFVGLLSLVTADLRLNVYAKGIGTRRLNLGTLLLGEQTTHTRAIIRTVRNVAESVGVKFLPGDTGGNRLHLIRAMLGEQEAQKAKNKEEKTAKNLSLLDSLVAKLQEDVKPIMAKVESNLSLDPRANLAQLDTSEIATAEPAILHPRAICSHNLQSLIHGAYNDMTLLLAQCLAGEKIHIQSDRAYRVNDSSVSVFAGSYFQGMVTREGQVNPDFLSQILPIYCSSYSADHGWEPDAESMESFTTWLKELYHQAAPQHTYKLNESGARAFERVRKFRLMTTELALSGYANHRALTLLRMAGMFCFIRRSSEIAESDINLAHMLLLLNETTIEICCIALHAAGTEARVWLTLVELVDKLGEVRVEEATRYLMDRAKLPARDVGAMLESMIGSERVQIDEQTGILRIEPSASDAGLASFVMQLQVG